MASPPRAREPWLARLTTRVGPPALRHVSREGAEVLCLPGRYSVTCLILSDHAVGIVDVGSTGDVPGILRALDRLGRRDQVRWVLPSHLHFDHMLGVDALARAVNAPVALGEAAARQVLRGERPRWPRRRHLLRAVPTWIYQGAPFPAREDWRAAREFGMPWAENRFGARLEVLPERCELDGLPGWQLLPTPGHSDDAVCLYHRRGRFLVAGDTVRNFSGGEWNPLLCSAEDYRRTRELLLSLEVETIFPAHGPLLEGAGIVGRLRTLPWYAP